MGLSDITDIDREDVSDFIWKWRCKILPRQDPINSKVKAVEVETEDDDSKGGKLAPVPRGKDPGFGAEAIVKTMFEGRNSTPAHFEWVDYPPKQLSKSAARAQDRAAMKVYMIKDREKPCIAGRFPLKYFQIEIQNPLLVAALEPILKKENVLLDVNESAEFKEPFRALWFCQEEIIDLYKKMDESETVKSYLHVLCRTMDDMFGDMRIKRRHLHSSGLIDFKTAWILFPRGSTVYSFGLNSEFLCKVDDTTYISKTEGTFLLIRCKVMMFNGEEFVWQNKALAIKSFEGNTPVRELDHYPLEFHPEAAEVKSRCVERGRKMLNFQGLQYCCYNGIALHSDNEGLGKHNVEGRVLIDVVGYNRYHLAKGSREDNDPKMERSHAGWHRRRQMPPPPPPPPHGDESDDEKEATKSAQKKRLTEEEQAANKADMLTREHELGFIYMMVGGYALKNKLWVQFYVEDIQPMVWNTEAYEHLVYDPQQKDLVLSFVENHNRQRVGANTSGKKPGPMDDVIQGKGQGLIILLSGPPGTGKTLTAEAVADRTRRPLFYLQAEDLGITAAALGANIKRVFEMATDWNAVVLLDEADVFMAERNPQDIHRNELVSIFLRELEYFRGIIFLTTNLYHTIDTAFRSRVSLHLVFSSLSKEARETVWRKFLDRQPPTQGKVVEEIDEGGDMVGDGEAEDNKLIDDDDVKQLSLWQLNGREIKNAVKMVRSWCEHKEYVLTLGRMENGIKVTSPHASKDGDVDIDLYE